MKFNKKGPCKMNEALAQNLGIEKKDDINSCQDPVTAYEAKAEFEKAEKEKENFKEFHKNADDFIKSNHERDPKVEKNDTLKKMKLRESAFDDVEEVEKFVVHFDEDGQNMDRWFFADEEEEAIEYAKENIADGPVMYKIDEETGIEEFYRDFDEDDISESKEEIKEALDFGDSLIMGRGACAPTVPDYSKVLREYVTELEDADEREANLLKKGIKRFVSQLFDEKQTIENFNDYWTKRYPAAIEFIDNQVAIIPDALLKELLSDTSVNVNESAEVADAPAKTRTRGEKEKKQKGDYSSEDLWLAVYDELSATTDNEGAGQQVDKKLKARKGERYEKVFPHGDSDIKIYAPTIEDFAFAKKVCEYYGVTYDEPKKEVTYSTSYYPYSMIIHIPKDKLYDWE